MVWNKTLSIQYCLYCPSGSYVFTEAELGHVLRSVVTEWQCKTFLALLVAYTYISMWYETRVRAHLIIVKHTSSFRAVTPVRLEVRIWFR
jgi:hypothetical protein